MMICNRCQREWNYEELGLACPYCRALARLDSAEAAALFRRAVTYEQDKKYSDAFKRYALLAEAGYPEGEEAYARCFEEGIGTSRDVARAADGYLDAAEHGSVRAAYRLAKMLSTRPRLCDGRGTALFWFRAAEALGSPDAAYSLSSSGDRYGLSDNERFAYLYFAAKGGHLLAARRIAREYRKGRHTPKDPAAALWFYRTLPRLSAFFRLFLRIAYRDITPAEPTVALPAERREALFALGEEATSYGFATTALRLFLLAAEQGSVDATCRAAASYREGIGTAPDLEAAVCLYRRAEECGSADAALMLGRIYEKERSNPTEAERHYRRAAEGGVAEHCYVLGDFYLAHDVAGEGVRQAVPWLRRAAESGCLPAADRLLGIENLLADIYNRAVEAQRSGNVREAFALFENAAASGHADALSNLGYCYQKGLGCAADPRAAAKAYREAVEAGSEAARLNLAVCYIRGIGINREYKRAEALLNGVAKPYREPAKKLLAEIEAVRQKKRAHRLYQAAAAAYHRGDIEGALRLRLASAKLGSPRACYMIGCHFEFGDGVALNREKASRWYETAATAGFSGGHARLKGGYLREKRRISLA